MFDRSVFIKPIKQIPEFSNVFDPSQITAEARTFQATKLLENFESSIRRSRDAILAYLPASWISLALRRFPRENAVVGENMANRGKRR